MTNSQANVLRKTGKTFNETLSLSIPVDTAVGMDIKEHSSKEQMFELLAA